MAMTIPAMRPGSALLPPPLLPGFSTPTPGLCIGLAVITGSTFPSDDAAADGCRFVSMETNMGGEGVGVGLGLGFTDELGMKRPTV